MGKLLFAPSFFVYSIHIYCAYSKPNNDIDIDILIPNFHTFATFASQGMEKFGHALDKWLSDTAMHSKPILLDISKT